MDQELGPFTITPTQIASLGAAFTPFVNALLRTEVAAAGLSGSLITTTYQENVGDDGVDAGLTRAIESRFVPAGESAWQFKRGDLQPAKCRTEIAGAAAALEILRNGGKYRLVLGGAPFGVAKAGDHLGSWNVGLDDEPHIAPGIRNVGAAHVLLCRAQRGDGTDLIRIRRILGQGANRVGAVDGIRIARGLQRHVS